MGGQKSKLMCCSEDYVHNRRHSAEDNHIKNNINNKQDNNTNSLIEDHSNQQPPKRKSSYQSDHYQTMEEQQNLEGKEQIRKQSIAKLGRPSENYPSSRVILTSCEPLHFEFNRYSFNTQDKRQKENLSESNHERNEIAMLNIINNFLEQKLYLHKNSCSTANTSNITLPDGYLSLPSNAQLKQSQLLNSQQYTATDDVLIENIAFVNQQTNNSNKTVYQTSSNSSASPNQSPCLVGAKGTIMGNPFELVLAEDSEFSVYLRQEANVNNNSMKYNSQITEYTLQNVSNIDEYLSKVELDMEITDQYSIASKQILFQEAFTKKGIQIQVIYVVFNQGCFKTPRDLLYLKVSQLIDDCQYIVAYRSISLTSTEPNEKKNDSTENFANRIKINNSSIYRHSGSGQSGSQVPGLQKIQGKRQQSQQKKLPSEEKYKRALLGLSGKRIVFDPQNKTLKIQEHLTLDMRTQSSHYVQKQLNIHAARKRFDNIKTAMKRQTEVKELSPAVGYQVNQKELK